MGRLSHSAIPRPSPLFLGYCLKQFPDRPDWLADPRVNDIASVTECFAKRPKDWVQRWDFNAAGLYDTPDQAAGALGDDDDPTTFHLFGYEFFPLRFDHSGNHVAIDPATIFGDSHGKPPTSSLAPGFECLGYDPVQRWTEVEPGHANDRALGGGFGCSPLFCNHCSTEHPVNRHCLLTEWFDAVHAARCFASKDGDGAEPGCYYIFGVHVRHPA